MTIYTHISANKWKSVLLVVVVLLILVAIGWYIDQQVGYGYAGVSFAVIVAVVMGLVGYFTGDRVALWTSGARPITKEENAYLHRIVENLSITAGLPVPKIYVIHDPAINAFATGRDPKHASIAVTTGAIEQLENEELEGVIAHELSHIGNYDIRFMTLVVILVGAITLLADMFWRSGFLFGGRRNSRGGGAGIFMIIGLALIILSPIIGQLIKLAVSRRREFLADASGILLTRYPDGLARALEKIARVNTQPMQRANNATAHLFLANPFGSHRTRGLARLFSTHPPVEERLAALRKMGT